MWHNDTDTLSRLKAAALNRNNKWESAQKNVHFHPPPGIALEKQNS